MKKSRFLSFVIGSLLAVATLAVDAVSYVTSRTADVLRWGRAVVVDTFFGLAQSEPKIDTPDTPHGDSAISLAQARSFVQRLMQRSVQRSGFGSMQSLHLAM